MGAIARRRILAPWCGSCTLYLRIDPLLPFATFTKQKPQGTVQGKDRIYDLPTWLAHSPQHPR